MSVVISRPPGINVGTNNPGDIVYIQGNESTDGSIRFEIVDFNGKNVAEIQNRTDGIWAGASLKTGPASVIVGLLISLSAAGNSLITNDTGGISHFHVRSGVDEGVTVDLSNIINATAFFERTVFFSDESTTFTGTNIEAQVIGTAIHLLTNKFYFKTGATAATSPVTVQSWKGVGDTGTKIFDQTYPASLFTADSEIQLTLDGFLEFEVGADTFTRISSDTDFSLKTNAALDQWWLAVDFSTVKNDDLLQTTEWESGDTFTKGDWSTQDRKVYEANVTGTQITSFDDNIDKWDQLISIQGFDRILNSNDGNSIANNAGNLLVGSA